MIGGMRSMRRARGGWIGAGVAVVATAMGIAGVTLALPATGPNRVAEPSRPPTPTETPGPIVFYEVLDAAGSSLMERTLDGTALARRVAIRVEVDEGRTWTVDRTGTIAVAVIPGTDEQRLDGVSIETGGTIWSATTPPAPVDGAVWAADGSRLALATIGTDSDTRQALVIDPTSGAVLAVGIPDDALLQGFDADGGLILRQHRVSKDGVNAGWDFLRIARDSLVVQRMAGAPKVGAASDGVEDVDPELGVAADTTLGAGDQDTAIRLWDLTATTSRVVATFPSIDRLSIDPAGRGLAISAGGAIQYVALGGGSSTLFDTDDEIADFGWSVNGDYLVVATDHDGQKLTVLERATGRTLRLPQAGRVAALSFVRMLDGVPLPARPLPAAEPSSTPIPGPAGVDIAGFDGILSTWVDRTGPIQVVHVERLVPTEGGGMRIAASMPPLDAGPPSHPDDGGPDVRLLPRPGTNEILVWVQGSEAGSGWIWDGATRLDRLALPGDWPRTAWDVAWRPEGAAVAARSDRATTDGGLEGTFVVATVGGRRTTVIPVGRQYDRLEGWWSATELQVGHAICFELCDGRYSWSARLRISDRRLVEMRAADRADGVIDTITPERSSIVMSLRNEDARDDIRIAWPADLGAADDLDVIGLAADRRSLVVAGRSPSAGTTLYRIDDPIGRTIDGKVDDPRPRVLARLEGHGLHVDLSPDQRWALVTDRVEDTTLVRLADGRAWPVDRDRSLSWPGGA